ncbi:MAG TPA: hypothetical protein VF846_16180 [Thermoanaerobaculia bacterium]|jgi:hypothetical protein
MRRLNVSVLGLALAFFLTLLAAPSAQAINKYEVDTTYYDECLDQIYERVIGCFGEVYTWGTSSAGAVYKNVVQIECEGSGYYSTWYVWNGTTWVKLSGMPPNC